MRVIKEFSDGVEVCFGRGRFDEFCVYLDGKPPKDIHYFTRLQQLASVYNGKALYDDFVSIYELVSRNVESAVLDSITKLSEKNKTHTIKMLPMDW